MRAALSSLFGEGFRIFFLAAGVYGFLSAAVWEVWLGVRAAGGMAAGMPFAPAPHHWHAHEMIFGYAGAALGGFFLTAVPNWTGAKPARTPFIVTAAALWFGGRAAVAMSAYLPPLLVATADLAFLPVLATKILTQLLRRPHPRNLMFVGLLALLWTANLTVHLDWSGLGGPGADAGLRAGLLTLIATISVLGGRITPAFTGNAMARAGRETGLPVSSRPLEGAAIAATVLLPLFVLFDARAGVTGVAALLAGTAQLARLAGWRSLWTLTQPILWSLHLAFAMLGLGLVAFGVAQFGLGSETAALHLLGIGAVGGMTIAVMCRAILGHTGHPLVAPRPATLAFLLIALAAFVRWAGSYLATEHHYWAAMLASGAAWIAAMVLFVLVFLPKILGPRATG